MIKSTRGYSLVETLVAVAIMGLLIIAVASLLSTVLASEKRNRAIGEVEAQANYALYQIAQSARNASSITTPATSTTGSVLRLVSVVSAENPTIITLASSTLQIKKGSAATTTLTGSKVLVSGLSFQNLSATSTKGSVRVGFTMSAVNTSGRPELNFTNAFYTSVTLR